MVLALEDGEHYWRNQGPGHRNCRPVAVAKHAVCGKPQSRERRECPWEQIPRDMHEVVPRRFADVPLVAPLAVVVHPDVGDFGVTEVAQQRHCPADDEICQPTPEPDVPAQLGPVPAGQEVNAHRTREERSPEQRAFHRVGQAEDNEHAEDRPGTGAEERGVVGWWSGGV